MIDNVPDEVVAVDESTNRAACVDLWTIRADDLSHSGRVNLDELSEEEISRFSRIKASAVRRRSFVIRWALRRLLSRYTRGAPGKLRISAGMHGKPELVGESGQRSIQFNVSHSDALGIVAVAFELPLGVDIELVRTLEHPQSFAKTVLSRREQPAFDLLGPAAQNQLLLGAWIAKEAALKASGLGLAVRPDQITMAGSWEDGGPLRLVSEQDAAQRWTATFFTPAPRFMGGIAFKGDVPLPQLRMFSPDDTHRCLLHATT